MLKLAILDDYLNCALELADWSKIASRCEIHVFDKPLGAGAAKALADFDILCLMRDRQPLDAALLAALPRLKFICFNGKMNGTLDAKAASNFGIPVSYTERGVGEATSELIWTLIMAVARDLPAQDKAAREGRWHTKLGVGLAGKTLGIIGLGRLGIPIAAYARAFKMNVIAWSPNLTEEKAQAAGAKRVDKDRLFAEADFVTVHMPLSERSRGLVGAKDFALMKPTAFFINTSRGPIADEAALIEALHSGKIAGAALDVYAEEPVPAGHPLTKAPNLILSPHLGFVTRENMRVFYEDLVEDVAAWLDGKPIRLLEPAVLQQPNLRR